MVTMVVIYSNGDGYGGGGGIVLGGRYGTGDDSLLLGTIWSVQQQVAVWRGPRQGVAAPARP